MTYQPPSDLVSAIKQQAAGDALLQQSLLLGGYGESGWSGNIYGFTDPSYGNAASLPASGQVAAILPHYKAAEANLPQGLKGAAAAEWIALGGEAPAFSTPATIQAYGIAKSGPTQEIEWAGGRPWYWDKPAIFGISQQEVIQQTGRPTQYGANRSLNQATIPGVWQTINQSLGTKSPVGGGGSGTQPQQPITNISGRNTAGNTGPTTYNYTNPQGYGQTYSQAVDIARQDMLQNPPASYPTMSGQIAASLYQQMNPTLSATTTDAKGNPQQTAGIVSDTEGFLTGGIIGNSEYAPIHLIFGTSYTKAAESILGSPGFNVWNNVRSTLLRLGIGLAGLLLMAAGLYVIVTATTGVSPVPVPV